MNWVPLRVVMFCRNAENLLDKVKSLFGEPSEKNEVLKNEVRDKLASYHTKVDDARDLLREARRKIWEADRLSAVNKKNMTVVEVSANKLYPWLLGVWSKLEILHD